MGGDEVAGTLHYLNADFDVSLRRRPGGLTPTRRRAVDGMTVLGLFTGGPEDRVLIRAGIPAAFLEYLERLEIKVPRPLVWPRMDRAMAFRPFGWSDEAIAMNAGQERPRPHPPADVVRRVNGRVYSASLERDLLGESDGGRPFGAVSEIADWLEDRRDSAEGWVVKADHGNGGLGNRRLRTRRLDDADRRFIGGLLEEDDHVVVEPWRERLRDFCVLFTLSQEGKVEGLRRHEAVTTRDGALIGAIFDPDKGEPGEEMERVARLVAGELSRAGYFGPVCLDAFLHPAGGKERLRPLVDLNCRRPVSDAIYPFWRGTLADRTLYWRFFTGRKLRLPSMSALVADKEHYCPKRRRGILLASPLRIEQGGKPLRAPKVAVAFVGESRAEVLRLEKAFRAGYER